jgi:hypothetical protein
LGLKRILLEYLSLAQMSLQLVLDLRLGLGRNQMMVYHSILQVSLKTLWVPSSWEPKCSSVLLLMVSHLRTVKDARREDYQRVSPKELVWDDLIIHLH